MNSRVEPFPFSDDSTAPAVRICARCGAPEDEAKGGYCGRCGAWLAAQPDTVSAFAPGMSVGPYRVVTPFMQDGAFALTSAGAPVVLFAGTKGDLDAEAQALGRLKVPWFGRVIEQGRDARIGPFLALQPARAVARSLAEVGPAMGPAEVVATLTAILEMAEKVAAAGSSWYPQPGDLWFAPEGGLVPLRLRRGTKLGRAPFDAKSLVEELSPAWVPLPAVVAPSDLVRLLVGHGSQADAKTRTLGAVGDALRRAKQALGRPDPTDPLGGICDPGLWRPYNQDATAYASGERDGRKWAVLVVCDGVSSSPRSDECAALAAAAVRDMLARHLYTGDVTNGVDGATVSAAIQAGHDLTCRQLAGARGEPPGATIAVALLFHNKLIVGWVGDSRVYWVGPGGGELLTRDHSVVNEVVARGEMTESEAMGSPFAHTITRCIGPLEGDRVEPDVASRELTGPGWVIVCSDGLWNYTPTVQQLVSVVHAISSSENATALARALANYGLIQGGQDNISVVVYRYG
ncbi:MAG TPA: PP2C family serine/threonine-protein phosphatase [Polyangiaceae bacterium]|nr:PP2C family serine/threonine-protein phosphatase [Polyangiaceae bacterium]